jgi:hypothetical protein
MKTHMKNSPVRATEVVQIPLMPEFKDAVITWQQNFDEVYDQLCELTQKGYNLTISYDLERGQYTARLAGIDASCENAGKLLYANGKTHRLAICSLAVKHFLVSKGGSWHTGDTQMSDFS